jgi:hypothetical protein
MASTGFQPNAFQRNGFQIETTNPDPGGTIVAHRTRLCPKSWREIECELAAKAERERAWDELPALIKLRIQLEQFIDEYGECLDFSNSYWAQHRMAELTELIVDTKRKIARHEEAEKFRKAHGLKPKTFVN